jgi:hypothetical protein
VGRSSALPIRAFKTDRNPVNSKLTTNLKKVFPMTLIIIFLFMAAMLALGALVTRHESKFVSMFLAMASLSAVALVAMAY